MAALVLVAGLIVWKSGGRDDAESVPSELRTRVAFRSEPVEAWDLNVDAVTSGSATFGSTELYSNQPGVRQFGDTVVTTVIDSSGGRGPLLVGIDADRGEVIWREAGDVKACAGELVDGMIACIARVGGSVDYSARPEIVFRDVGTGRVETRATAPYRVSAIAVVDGDVITTGYADTSGSTGRIFSSGSPSNLAENWTVTRPINLTGCPGSGDMSYFVADSDVVGAGNGVSNQFVRTSDGSPVIHEDLAQAAYQPGGGFRGVTCPTPSSYTLKLYDLDGALLRSHEGLSTLQRVGTVASDVVPAPYAVNGALFDFASGDKLWSMGTGSDWSMSTSELIGDTLLVDASDCTGCEQRTTAFDVTSGEKLWSASAFGLYTRNSWLTDGDRLLTASEGWVTATDLGTGEQAWTSPYSDGENGATLYPVGDGFLIVTSDRLQYVVPD